MPPPHHPSMAVRRALQKLGAEIRDARRRRALPAEVIAQRAFTSRPTLRRIEAGDHTVGIGIYAAVLHALGLLEGLADLAAPGNDRIGMTLATEKLPQRVHLPKSRKRNDGR
jgi:hypothetical protein